MPGLSGRAGRTPPSRRAAAVLLGAVLGAGAGCARPQSALPRAEVEVAADARLGARGASCDFGAVLRGQWVLCRFDVLNDGARPFATDDYRRQCGCSVVTADVAAIAPGARGRITVRIDTARLHLGPQEVTVRFGAEDAGGVASFELRCTGAVAESAAWPAADAIIHGIPRGTGRTAQIAVTSPYLAEDAGWSVRCALPGVTPSLRGDPASGAVGLELAVARGGALGRERGEVELVPSEPGGLRLRIPLELEIVADVHTDARGALLLPRSADGHGESTFRVMTHKPGRAVVVEEVRVEPAGDGAVAPRVTRRADGLRTCVTVAIDEASARTHHGRLLLRCNDGEPSELLLPYWSIGSR